ncbi:MAG: hypothetical protein JWR48_462 [Mycobacterium sp.]|nr:hypothetical protein [Mycobacterium sp.]
MCGVRVTLTGFLPSARRRSVFITQPRHGGPLYVGAGHLYTHRLTLDRVLYCRLAPNMVRARTIGVRAAPVPVMAVQVCGPSAVWMDRTALAPSPTAEATRFTEGQADVFGGEYGGHAGFIRQGCAPDRCPGGAEFLGV